MLMNCQTNFGARPAIWSSFLGTELRSVLVTALDSLYSLNAVCTQILPLIVVLRFNCF